MSFFLAASVKYQSCHVALEDKVVASSWLCNVQCGTSGLETRNCRGTAELSLRPVKKNDCFLLQRQQAAPYTPTLHPSLTACLVRAVSDQCGSSILRRGSRCVMLLGNGTLALPIMRQAQKPERLSGLSSSASERRCLSGSTCATK